MSCGACNCDECEEDRVADAAMNRSNDMDDEEEEEEMPPTPRWYNVEPANEVQAKAWLGYVNESLDKYNVQGMPMVTLLSVVAQKIPGLRPENYSMVIAQVEKMLRESPDFEFRKGKSGGIFRKALNFPIASGTLPAPIHNVVAVTVSDNYTCKGCGNTKLNSKEKSCWKCGRTVGT